MLLHGLVAGIETMHDDERRRAFLLELGADLDRVTRWLRDAGLDGQVSAAHAPTFLHGGSSADKWIVLGINPGADDQSMIAEEQFKRGSPEQYLAFHDDFFTHFPRLRRNGKQPWWTKLYRVTRVLEGIIAGPGEVPWAALQRSSTFVVQDLVPFHGKTSATIQDLDRTALGTIAGATLEGIARSKARGALVLSRDGYKLFERHPRVSLMRRFPLEGKTSRGSPRTILGYFARLGRIPLVALDNEYVAQPTIPYEQSLPLLLNEMRREGLISGMR